MAVNVAALAYKPVYDVLARPCTVFPVGSQPGKAPYNARCIPGTQQVDVEAQDGSIISDQITIIDILEPEFEVLPAQFDRITIPEHIGMPAMGEFEITDTGQNGGGETTLNVRKWEPEKP